MVVRDSLEFCSVVLDFDVVEVEVGLLTVTGPQALTSDSGGPLSAHVYFFFRTRFSECES